MNLDLMLCCPQPLFSASQITPLYPLWIHTPLTDAATLAWQYLARRAADAAQAPERRRVPGHCAAAGRPSSALASQRSARLNLRCSCRREVTGCMRHSRCIGLQVPMCSLSLHVARPAVDKMHHPGPLPPAYTERRCSSGLAACLCDVTRQCTCRKHFSSVSTLKMS